MRMPMFGFLALGFLFFAAVVAVACYLVFKSGEQGKTKLSGCAGCGIGFAILCVGGLGALGCTAVALMSIPDELVRHGPVKSFEWHWPRRHATAPDAPPPPDAPEAPGAEGDEHDADADHDRSHLLQVEVRGTSDYSAVARSISSWLRDATDADFSVETRSFTRAGEKVIELSFDFPKDAPELDEMRSDLEEAFSTFDLPEGVRVEIKSDHDD